ncbi:hypothetical protein NKI04_21625 [Mesorhizobium sp. M0814]|uniref:hypothetical protein n=1 Tax=Mesorhizobium sp. M0814 TaxID=2957004 RepID=UPI0033355F84
MTGLLDTSAYDRVFALDTQMVFEARPLTQLPWSTLSSGPILLLILPQVSSEADARKRDGRLATRARELNRMLDPSIELGRATQLVAKPLRVDIAYVAAGRPDWDRLDDLDRENGDDRIVAQALHAKIDNPSRVEILSFDSRPRAGARRHGLGALKPDETWLLDQEPSPSDRRVAELERRVQLLQANEPSLRLSISTPEPLVRTRVPELAAESVKPVVRMILAKNRREQNSGYFDVGLHSNPYYDSDYDNYSRDLSQIDIPSIHSRGCTILLAALPGGENREYWSDDCRTRRRRRALAQRCASQSSVHSRYFWPPGTVSTPRPAGQHPELARTPRPS